jgi:hypothetical protein
MNRTRLAYEIQQHPQDPAKIAALVEHELAKATKHEAIGAAIQAQVAFQRALSWEAKGRALRAALAEAADQGR